MNEIGEAGKLVPKAEMDATQIGKLVKKNEMGDSKIVKFVEVGQLGVVHKQER